MASIIIGTFDGRTLMAAPINLSTSGDQTLVAAVANQIIRCYKIFFVVTLTNNVTFKDGASTALSGAIPLAANGALALDMDGQPWFTTSAGNAFILNMSASTQTSGTVYYTQGLGV